MYKVILTGEQFSSYLAAVRSAQGSGLRGGRGCHRSHPLVPCTSANSKKSAGVQRTLGSLYSTGVTEMKCCTLIEVDTECRGLEALHTKSCLLMGGV